MSSNIRRRRARKARVKDIIDRKVSEALESCVNRTILTRYEVDQFYMTMDRAGFHGLGYDPDPAIDETAFGKPFWKRVQPPYPSLLKKAILNRLTKIGMSMEDVRNKLKKEEVKPKTKIRKTVGVVMKSTT